MTTEIRAQCEQVLTAVGDVKVFKLRVVGRDATFLDSLRPGGHVAIRYPDTRGLHHRRYYSITRKETPDTFEIVVKRSGCSGVSDHLHQSLHAGSTVTLQYAGGDITVDSVARYDRIAMVAGGIGVTVPIALLRELAAFSRSGEQVPEVVLLLCVPRIVDISFLHELLQLDLTTAWFSLRVFVTREAIRESDHFLFGRPSGCDLSMLNRPQAAVICGSHSFTRDFHAKFSEHLPDVRLLVESFTSPVHPPLTDVDKTVRESSEPSVRLRILGSNRVIEASPGASLLEILEDNGVQIRSQCRSGICGSCRVKILGGQCRSEPDFCLSEHDRRDGHALACCTFPLSGDVEVNVDSSC